MNIQPHTENKSKKRKTELHIQQTSFHSGPLPPAAELQQFDSILPGLADRIVTMAEKEQSNAHELQRITAKGAHRMIFAGWLCAFLTLLGLMVLAYFAMLARMAVVAGLIITSLGVASIFAYKGIKRFI